MRPSILLSVLLTACLATAAHARTSGFTVSVEVVDRRAASVLLDAIPVPQDARPFASENHGRSYVYPGDLAAAVAFFDAQMPQRGYRVVDRSDGAGGVRQLWEGEHGQVLLRLQSVLGSAPGTRIRVDAATVFRHPHASAPGTSVRSPVSNGMQGRVSAAEKAANSKWLIHQRC